MNKERELLQRVVTAWEDDRFELIDAMVDVVVDIQEYFANQETDTNQSETISNPEIDKPKREALSLAEISSAYLSEIAPKYAQADADEYKWMVLGVRFAEKHHGITGGGDE